MEKEIGASIDINKSSTMSVPGNFNPLVIIKKLNFNHTPIEAKDRGSKSPINNPQRKQIDNNGNTKITNNPSKLAKLKLKENLDLNKNKTENEGNINNNKEKEKSENNNSLLKSLKNNKINKEKSQTHMSNTNSDFNSTKKSSMTNIFSSSIRSEKENKENNNKENKERYGTDKTVMEKFDKKNKNIFLNRSEKIHIIDKENSKKNNNTIDESLNNSNERLETIMEKEKIKRKKKKNDRNNSKTKKDFTLPNIIRTKSNKNFDGNNNNIKTIKEKNEDDTVKELKKNYSSNLTNFQRTSLSVFSKEKKSVSKNPNKNSNNQLDLNENDDYATRYLNVMKSYRDKKLHLFDKNKYFYVRKNCEIFF